jgi:multiple sugar transport system substrate-binding protein
VIVYLLATLLTGCDDGALATDVPIEETPPPETPAASEQVEITYACWDVDRDLMEVWIEEFEEQNSDVAVNLLGTDIRTLVSATGDWDVADVWVPWLAGLQEENRILELDTFIEADGSFDRLDSYDGALESAMIDGNIWLIPYGTNPMVMYYNTDLFDQAGIPYPKVNWSWTDFVAAAAAIHNPDAGVYGYANATPGFDVLLLALRHGASIWDDPQNPAHPVLDDPLMIEVLEWYGDLYDEHDVAYLPESKSRRQVSGNDEIWALVRGGHVGIWSGGYAARVWDPDLPPGYGMVNLPRSADATAEAIGRPWLRGYVIFSDTSHPLEAWRLISFLSWQKRSSTAIPVRRSIAESDDFIREVGNDVAAVAWAELETLAPISPRGFGQAEGDVWGVLGSIVIELEYGEITAQQAAEMAQQEADAQEIGPR